MKKPDPHDLHLVCMSEMLERLQIEPSAAARSNFGNAFGASVHACEDCEAGEACRDWLMRAGSRIAKAPAFCPNVQRFDWMRLEQHTFGRKRSVH
jgi:hypothetical protein